MFFAMWYLHFNNVMMPLLLSNAYLSYLFGAKIGIIIIIIIIIK